MFGKSWAHKRPDKIIPQIYDAITDSLAFARIICGVVVQMSWINNNTTRASPWPALCYIYFFFSRLCAHFDMDYLLRFALSLSVSSTLSYHTHSVRLYPPLHSVYRSRSHFHACMVWMLNKYVCMCDVHHRRRRRHLIIIIEKHFFRSLYVLTLIATIKR